MASTLNPQPSTLNPQPSTLNPQPSTLNPQPSTLNPDRCKHVYIVSDSTGFTASHALTSVMAQVPPLPSEEGTNRMVLKTFVQNMAQAKARIWP